MGPENYKTLEKNGLTDLLLGNSTCFSGRAICVVLYLLVASQIPTDVDKTSLEHGKTSVGFGPTLLWPEDLGYQIL